MVLITIVTVVIMCGLFITGLRPIFHQLAIQVAGIQRCSRAVWILPIKVEVVVAHLVLDALSQSETAGKHEDSPI